LTSEAAIRLGAFITVFTAMALWEAVAPRRARSYSRLRRWPSNLSIVALNTVLVRLLLPVTAVSLALAGEKWGWGLLNNLPVPAWVAVVSSVVVLDLAIYLQHVMFHAVPALWRVHRMHHSDLDFDVSTGARFHPIEIVLSMLIKCGAVVALGASALGVLLFEVLLNATSMFNHGNARVPARLDHYLRWFVVTPDMHRVHHSIVVNETNSNFGFNLPWWDRLLETYRDQPAAGHEGMTIGIEQFRQARQLWLDRMLLQPFRGPRVVTRSPGDARHEMAQPHLSFGSDGGSARSDRMARFASRISSDHRARTGTRALWSVGANPVRRNVRAFRVPSLGGSRKGHSIARRIQYRLDGTMVIKCDNPKYPEEVYALDSRNLPVPFGRVAWRAGRV
jgi:sterol desaturase/sphingolipid hydroxylase (fatty acid hydroxylase superfamily)